MKYKEKIYVVSNSKSFWISSKNFKPIEEGCAQTMALKIHHRFVRLLKNTIFTHFVIKLVKTIMTMRVRHLLQSKS